MSEDQLSNETYEVYALRYASRSGHKSGEYYGFGRYGEPDAPIDLDYYFWLARNPQRTFVVDCGFSPQVARERGRRLENDPIDVLALLGIAPGDVDHVVISHMHSDHVGNLQRFPNATFSIARDEFDFCSGPYARKPLMADVVDHTAVGVVKDLRSAGRVRFVEASEMLFPGVQVTTLGGHSPGQMITLIATDSGHVTVASDALHFYEELDLDRPFWFFYDIEATYRGYEKLRELAAAPGSVVVPGHDPEVMKRFKTVHHASVVDLTAPLAASERA